jgi:hypothetical protein
VSFLTKIRAKIHTTPGLRQVSQTWANTFGMGKAYAEFDQKIGYSESGEPAPAAVSQFSPNIDRADLASYAAEQYPGTAMLVGNYRQFARATGSVDRRAVYQPPAEDDFFDYENEDQSESYSDEWDDQQ